MQTCDEIKAAIWKEVRMKPTRDKTGSSNDDSWRHLSRSPSVSFHLEEDVGVKVCVWGGFGRDKVKKAEDEEEQDKVAGRGPLGG